MTGCLLCGVGGQGTVLASRLLAEAAMHCGWKARTAETIGMAQRGGCVVSHVRWGAAVHSPLIPWRGADLLLGFEPGEAARGLPYLKPDGWAVVCQDPIPSVLAALGGSPYDAEAVLDHLRAQVRHLVLVDGKRVAKECGTDRVLNVALLGAAMACGSLDLSESALQAALRARMRPELLEINLRAFALGVLQAKEGGIAQCT